ncbi:MAG: ion channel [Pseudomonadota bacterium]
MLVELALGFGFTCLTIALAVGFIIVATEVADVLARRWAGWPEPLRDASILTVSVIWMLVGILLVVFSWALLFAWLGLFEDFEARVYFALVSITTVGFGDVFIAGEWRLLGGFVAADGFIIFGLDTAALFEILRQLRTSELGAPAPPP